MQLVNHNVRLYYKSTLASYWILPEIPVITKVYIPSSNNQSLHPGFPSFPGFTQDVVVSSLFQQTLNLKVGGKKKN